MGLRFRTRPFFQAPIELTNPGSTGGNQWFGRARVSSDTNGISAVVSTQLVAADSLIFVTLQGHVAVGSVGFPQVTFVVASISPGNFFRLATTNSVGAVGSLTAMWALFNPAG